jgi:peptidoglycan/xylan/chitin deacetylase (PgdA/CDA1 family)
MIQRFFRMLRSILPLLFVFPLVLAGCKKSSKVAQAKESDSQKSEAVVSASAAPSATPAPTPIVEATPAPTPVPTPEIDRSARAIVLCYHRFEDKPRDSLAIAPADFKTQMQALKDNGIAVISMSDLLAWRRGEKSIPAKSAVITIDDGYDSGYQVAWPILKEFGYPFTMFVYTNYINAGGKSVTWTQLEEMRDAGVDIESHTVSHRDLRRGIKGQDYDSWLRNEVVGSKELLEQKLGIRVIAFAFPYGLHNEKVRKLAMESGYEALFTVYGQHMAIDAPADQLGRYAIESNKPEVFKMALEFGGGANPTPGVVATQLAAVSMVTQPMNDERITDPKPVIKANLATMGEIDSASIEMRISGFGLVPATYDPQTKLVSYSVTQKLLPRTYTVILSAKVKGKKVETRWNFTVEAPTAAAVSPGR